MGNSTCASREGHMWLRQTRATSKHPNQTPNSASALHNFLMIQNLEPKIQRGFPSSPAMFLIVLMNKR